MGQLDTKLKNFRDLTKCLNVKNIDSSTKFWIIRTKRGCFYDEFISEGFIALGWNTIAEKELLDIKKANGKKAKEEKEREKLENNIKTNYPRNKQIAETLNKCIRFFDEMKEGDIVMIPSAKSKIVSFAVIGNYYEDINCTYEKEVEIINRIDSDNDYGMGVKCPYKKRRKITLLKTIDGKKLNIHLREALASYHGLSNIDKYSDFVLSSIYNLYYSNNKINMVFNIEKEEEVGALDLSQFIHSSSKLLSLSDDNIKIFTRSNLNCPGELVLIVQECNNIINAIASPELFWKILLIWIAIGNGKIGGFEFPSLPNIIMNLREHNSKMENDKLDRELKEKQIKKEEIQIEEEQKKLQILNTYYNDIKEAATKLEINKDDSSNIIDFSKYHHGKSDE